MAKKPDEEKDISFPNQKIVNINLEHEMENAYIEYAMSVIVGRALPDVRDGLKPVHRRILYSMYESGLTSDKPHGDASVYDAMVRLGQDFSMRYCLVEGHGNFGSIDGDPPAAYRYTEARMSKIANEMLRDIEKETVDWDPNFDESRKEPRVLPSRFPNLLVNGSSGIAVGMTTNIPPHNLREVIDATICVLDNREATLDDLMEHIKGPDFPTRGIIMGRSGIRAAYATGKGHIRVRARTEMEEFGNGRTRIIVTELPYQVNKSRLVENIADQVKEKRLEGISGLRDESDGKKGMRIVIELKKDANPQVVLNRLFAQTQMQTTFAVVMLALVNNQRQPKILTLRGGAGPPAPGTAHRPGQHRRGYPHHPHQLRRRQGQAHGALRPGRRAGPGHPGHAAQAAPGSGKREAGGGVRRAGEEDRLLRPAALRRGDAPGRAEG